MVRPVEDFDPKWTSRIRAMLRKSSGKSAGGLFEYFL